MNGQASADTRDSKRSEGIDSRLAALETPVVPNPLQKYLRMHEYGTFKKSDDDSFACDQVEDLWQETLDELGAVLNLPMFPLAPERKSDHHGRESPLHLQMNDLRPIHAYSWR